MTDLLLLLGVALAACFGWWLMKRLDRFLDSRKIDKDE